MIPMAPAQLASAIFLTLVLAVSAGDTITSSGLSIKSSSAEVYLCAITELKSEDKLYHYTVGLDGSTAKLVKTISVPWDPKEGWKRVVCGAAPMQVLTDGEEDTLLLPISAIDCNPNDCVGPGVAMVSPSKGSVLARTAFPKDAGNALGMSMDTNGTTLFVSTYHAKLLKYSITDNKLQLESTLDVPSPCAMGFYPLMAGLTYVSFETKKVHRDSFLFGAIFCAQSSPFPTPEAGSVLQVNVAGKMSVAEQTALPGSALVGSTMAYRRGDAGSELFVPAAVQCSDEPSTICAAMFSLALGANTTVTQLGPLWNSSQPSPFYGEPSQALMATEQGFLVSGIACAPSAIPPVQTEAAAGCTPDSSPRVALFPLDASGSLSSPIVSTMPGSIYHFVSRDAKVIFGVQSFSISGPDKLVAMKVDPSTNKVTVTNSVDIPVVPITSSH